MDRREFLRRAASSGLLAGPGSAILASCAEGATQARVSTDPLRARLYLPPGVSPEALTLRPHAATAEIVPGTISPVLTWDGGPVGPTIRARTGQRVSVLLQNGLAEPTIVHWHGLRPPEEADGHPRLAVGPGGSYRYDFQVTERAGLYWYHTHPHMRTAEQAYYGLTGLIVVRDEAEDALDLPSGDRELLLVLQDKRQDSSGRLVFGVAGHQLMEGFLGDAAFVNGVRTPRMEVAEWLYRLRVLNASTSRIFRLALSDGAPLTLIGTDAGLIERPAELPYVDLGTGERVDLLVDFSRTPAGGTVRLRSLAFPSPSGGMGMGMGMGMRGTGGLPQGAEMEVLEFAVTGGQRERGEVPATLVPVPRLARSDAARERVFRFDSMMMSHTINGRAFEMERVDERVPFGATEVWTFVNDSAFPHPVHVHAVHFQVLARHGGRNQVLPWEQGWKDTVLVYPGERVEVIARFDSHRGLFLLHCHNMVHEDHGMMMNFLIE